MPIEDPPKRGFSMYGPAKGSDGVVALSSARGKVGTPAWTMRAPKVHLSIPSAAPATVGPL